MTTLGHVLAIHWLHHRGGIHYQSSIAIQQSQPAATPQEASMFTVINNITEVATRLGSDITVGEAVELAGKHFLAVSDGGTVRLVDVDAKSIGEVVPSAAYTSIGAAISLSNS